MAKDACVASEGNLTRFHEMQQMNSTLNLLTLLLLLVLPGATVANASELYVDPAGSDTNPGTRSQPLATLDGARLAARKTTGTTTIYLRGGTFYLHTPLVLTAEDSGAAAHPIVYRAYPGEKPVISGGVKLDLKWKPYRDGIMQADVPADLSTDQLFVNGARQVLARYPNYNEAERVFHGYAADAWSPERIARWKDPAGGYMHAMHELLWGGFSWQITGKELRDGVPTLLYEGGWQNNRPAGAHPQYRFVENIFEELDAPGEWFLDRKAHTIYFYPPAGLDLNHALIEAPRLKHLIEFRGSEQMPVRGISFEGITFRHTLRTFMENREPLLRSDWTTYRGGAILFDGAEQCSLRNCSIDQAGGNAIFFNNFNRKVTIYGCHIARAGGNGIAFVGDPAAVRNPNGWTGAAAQRSFKEMDLTPGPRNANYPADCLVDQCLIHETGQVEKQTAPIQISMAAQITVRHCSLYDVPRAGINIGDGCWGGHVIEFCDIFDTVKETGDHGSFNSWGRDRWWGTEGIDLQTVTLGENKNWPELDAREPVTLRNNRWRCDHGWDIDLDDGSTNYIIENNLCLNGGIKNREGFYRRVQNNIIVNNTFHPHVWYRNSQDLFLHNIVMEDRYRPAGGMPGDPWGRDMDYNLVHRRGMSGVDAAAGLAAQSHRDSHSVVADAEFIDPVHGDYRVANGSPALKLGFKNFAMDRFGVTIATLKPLAKSPELPAIK